MHHALGVHPGHAEDDTVLDGEVARPKSGTLLPQSALERRLDRHPNLLRCVKAPEQQSSWETLLTAALLVTHPPL